MPFLKQTNERFKKSTPQMSKDKRKKTNNKAADKKKTNAKDKSDAKDKADGKDGADDKQKAKDDKLRSQLPKNKRAFEKEVTLMPDTTLKVVHSKKTRRLIVSAKTQDGKH